MFKKITETTAAFGLGTSPQRQLHKIASGPYANRMIASFLSAAGTLQYSYADPPYTAWSTPVAIASDAADASFDSVLDSQGNVHVFYSTVTNYFLTTRKLSVTAGGWSVGSAVTIYNANITASPACVLDESGVIWIAWSEVVSGSHTLCVKSSADDGATWGTGPTDPGDILSTGSAAVYPRLLAGSNNVYLVYVDGISSMLFRSRAAGGSSWSGAETIASGMTLDFNFDAAISSTGKIAVAYDQNGLKYRGFDGSVWDAVVSVDSDTALFPQVIYDNNKLYIVYLVAEASDQRSLRFVTLNGATFSTPQEIDPRASYLGSVMLFDLSDGSYSDQTATAASAAAADLFHPVSGRLVESTGDALFLGVDQKFRYLSIHLSTTAVGGSVAYSYFDGINWKSFTPAGGVYTFDSPDKSLLLWDDYSSIPSDWQKSTVNSETRFWIRVEVSSDFTTAPIGSRITTMSDVQAFAVRR